MNLSLFKTELLWTFAFKFLCGRRFRFSRVYTEGQNDQALYIYFSEELLDCLPGVPHPRQPRTRILINIRYCLSFGDSQPSGCEMVSPWSFDLRFPES